LPVFGGDFRGESRKLSNSFRDKRVSYFIDPRSLIGDLWESVLKTEREVAWDVYLLYAAGGRWEEQEPPMPDFWMHQLTGVTKAPRLEEPEFRKKLQELLTGSGATKRNAKREVRQPQQ
jgi:hypothetical protein